MIIATRDRPRLLARAVESALAAGDDVEVIVVDHASATDEAERVCRWYEGVRYLHVPRNQQLGGARNIGLLASRGSYITFLDDDAARLPRSIDWQREVLRERREVGLVYGQALLESAVGGASEGKYPEPCPEGDVFWPLMEHNFIPCPSAMFRREVLFKIGLPEDSTPGIEDWDYWLRIAELWPFAALDFPVAVYRKAAPRSGRFTSEAASLVRLITVTYERKWMRLPRAAKADRQVRERARKRFSQNMATHLVREAGRSLARREVAAAAHDLWAAVRLHPAATLALASKPSYYVWAGARVKRILGLP